MYGKKIQMFLPPSPRSDKQATKASLATQFLALKDFNLSANGDTMSCFVTRLT